MRKPVRKVRRFFRKAFGKGKGKGKRKGKRLGGKGISTYVVNLPDDEYEELFFGRRKGKVAANSEESDPLEKGVEGPQTLGARTVKS